MSGGGALDSSVTLDEVFTVLAAKRVPLAPELSGYLVLEIAEHADPQGGDVDPRSVFIGEEGTVALVKPKRTEATGSAEGSVRAILSRLLEVSGSQTPALAAAGKRKGGSSLSALAEELETALIPVNRAAGRRALARLAREVRRVTLGVGRNALPSSSDMSSARRALPSSHPPASEPPAPRSSAPSASGFTKEEDTTTQRRAVPSELLNRATPAEWLNLPTTQFEPPPSSREPTESQADVDALIDQFGASNPPQDTSALKAMAGLEPTPPPPPRARESGRAVDDPAGSPDRALSRMRSHDSQAELGDVDALLAHGAGSGRPPRVAHDPRQLATQPSQLRKKVVSLPSAPLPRRSRLSPLVPVLALLVVGAGAYAAVRLRPAGTSKAVGNQAPASAESTLSSARPASTGPAAACRGTLVVSNVPAHAEVLLRQGQAPIDVEKMPVGARLEFVATAEGYAPRRVVVPKGAPWDTGADGKPRIETAVQLDKAKVGSETWPSGEPGSEVGGEGPPGTVHVVATPRGAEVWLLAGLGPEARIGQLRCDRDFDVLVAGPTTFRRRIHVSPRDFHVEEPKAPPIARVGVK